MINNHAIRFVHSEIPGLEHNIRCVIFTPENKNDLFINVGLYDSISAMNAIRDFVAGNTSKAGDMIHVHSSTRSKYDGFKSIYVGGNRIKQAIIEGYAEMTVMLGDDPVTITLPKTDELIGEWCQVRMKTQFWGRAVPANDGYHLKNTVMKHEYLEKLLNGTKLVIFTDPTVQKDGTIFDWGSKAALSLEADLFNEDGTYKTSEEIMAPVYEKMNERQGDQKLDRQTQRLEKLSQVLSIPVISTVTVDEVSMDVSEVPNGKYCVKDKSGFVKQICINVVNNLDSQNRLRTVATNGWHLESRK